MSKSFNCVFDSRSNWVLPKILDVRSKSHANKPFLQDLGKAPVTFAEVEGLVDRLAAGLAELGIGKEDKVLIMMPNCVEFVYIWFAINKLGAVEVPVNNAYKGHFLEHVANNSEAKLVVADTSFVERLRFSKKNLRYLKHVVLFSMEGKIPEYCCHDLTPFKVSTFDELLNCVSVAPHVDVKYSDLSAIMFTSGTTGPSKGVMSSHAHTYMCAIMTVNMVRLTEDDVYLTCQPLFHGNAQWLSVYPALIVGARAVITPRFTASGWSSQVREAGATVTNMQGVMMDFIFRQPHDPVEAVNRLRAVYAVPSPPEILDAFKRRFGVETVIESYGQTELGLITSTPYGEYRAGSCGKGHTDWYEIRLADSETDEPVSDGQPGEMLIRSRKPWTIFSGYYRMPEATCDSFRNLWYHTGDILRRDPDGWYFFTDRTKDSIRRRAENISSYEIEMVLTSHSAIRECAAIAVKSDIPGGEDEVKVCVAVEAGRSLSPQDLVAWAEDRMPYFAVPRYVEFMDILPKTPTEKVEKAALRERGVNENTWDREKAGFKLKEEIRKEQAKAERRQASHASKEKVSL